MIYVLTCIILPAIAGAILGSITSYLSFKKRNSPMKKINISLDHNDFEWLVSGGVIKHEYANGKEVSICLKDIGYFSMETIIKFYINGKENNYGKEKLKVFNI